MTPERIREHIAVAEADARRARDEGLINIYTVRERDVHWLTRYLQEGRDATQEAA